MGIMIIVKDHKIHLVVHNSLSAHSVDFLPTHLEMVLAQLIHRPPQLGLGKLFPKIHLLFYSFIPKFSAYYSLKPAHYSFKPAYYSYIILKLILKTS